MYVYSQLVIDWLLIDSLTTMFLLFTDNLLHAFGHLLKKGPSSFVHAYIANNDLLLIYAGFFTVPSSKGNLVAMDKCALQFHFLQEVNRI